MPLTSLQFFIALFCIFYYISRYIHPESFHGLISLRSLLLDYNDLIFLEPLLFLPLSRLSCLDLSNNKHVNISTSTFEYLVNLKDLDIRHTQIQKEIKVFVGLDRLIKMKICQVPLGGFQLLPHLTSLEMSHCNVQSVQPWFIQHLPDLQYVSLSRNELTQIPKYAFTSAVVPVPIMSNNELNSAPSGWLPTVWAVQKSISNGRNCNLLMGIALQLCSLCMLLIQEQKGIL